MEYRICGNGILDIDIDRTTDTEILELLDYITLSELIRKDIDKRKEITEGQEISLLSIYETIYLAALDLLDKIGPGEVVLEAVEELSKIEKYESVQKRIKSEKKERYSDILMKGYEKKKAEAREILKDLLGQYSV